MKTQFIYLGSTKETHMKIVSLGCQMGLQDIRKMTMGEKLAELANGGNNRAIKICLENPQFFGQETTENL